MAAEQSMQVIDARAAWYRWNDYRFGCLQNHLSDEFIQYIHLIPLFMQLNHRLLPGYMDKQVPLGVYQYEPGKQDITRAQKLNNKFRYQSEGVIRNYALDSVYIQRRVIDGKLYCWLLLASSLSKQQHAVLGEKADKISDWFRARGLKIQFFCMSSSDFRENRRNSLKDIDHALFMDFFYAENILLAGKYPVWWLVPPAEESRYDRFVEHIRQARFVDNEEYIDTGGLSDSTLDDILRYSIDQAQSIRKSAEISLVALLLADQKIVSWPGIEGLACRLKFQIYQDYRDIDPEIIVADILRDAFERYADTSHVISPRRLFLQLKNNPGKLNRDIIEAFNGDDMMHEPVARGIDHIITSLDFYKALHFKIQQAFSNIVDCYKNKTDSSALDESLIHISENLITYLSDNAERVPIYNSKDNAEIIFDRILLRHETAEQGSGRWHLVLEMPEGDERNIEGFGSLLGLLAWCWLNRLVNNMTQLSIDCPLHQIKQVEARYVLEVLMQQLKPASISQIPAVEFEKPARPLQSLLFVNFMSMVVEKDLQITEDDDPLNYGLQQKNLLSHCEQLIINSWGDVYTRKYSGNMGLLQCLCDWTHSVPLGSGEKPPPISAFGHGTGDSTYMAQRIDQVYGAIIGFFYSGRKTAARFILRLAADYYVIYIQDDRLQPAKIGHQRALIRYLESPLPAFENTGLERLAYSEYPLREIYQKNKSDVLQVFFQIINRRYHCWVLDEKGSLWSDVVEVYDTDSYVTHWLYLFRNILARLKNINYQNRALPRFEIQQISHNQLGGIEFNHLSADDISTSKNYIELRIKIVSRSSGDELSIDCNGQLFDFQQYQQNVLNKCVAYISEKRMAAGFLPVFISDIDVPLKLYEVAERDAIQISHILKFKRRFEHRINQLLNV